MFKGDIRLIYTKNSFERFLNEDVNETNYKRYVTIYENLGKKGNENLFINILKSKSGSFLRTNYKIEFDKLYEIWIKEKQNASTEI